MIIASRILKFRDPKGDRGISIDIHAPEQDRVDWICRFEIGWPNEKAIRWGSGVDAVQALLQAFQMIGAEIYTSDLHASGRLSWFEQGNGYGFPVPNNIRDLLIGADAEFL
ncbi:MAG: hypothetical protein V4602_15165 [Pseudomonadota bacterium]